MIKKKTIKVKPTGLDEYKKRLNEMSKIISEFEIAIKSLEDLEITLEIQD